MSRKRIVESQSERRSAELAALLSWPCDLVCTDNHFRSPPLDRHSSMVPRCCEGSRHGLRRGARAPAGRRSGFLKRIAETALEEIIAVDTAAPVVDPDPIYAAIEAHPQAYVAYDEAAEAPDEENDEAFRALDRTSQHLLRAEATTIAGLIALLRYVATLLQEAGSPGLPIEVPFAGRWSAAFGTFCAHVADRLPAILTSPECVVGAANAIVAATAPFIDDFEMARRAARAAIEAIAS